MSLNIRRNIEERKQFEEGERQETEIKLAPVLKEMNASLRKMAALTKLYWSQPLAHLAQRIAAQQFDPDYGVTFSVTTEHQDGTRGRAEYQAFVSNLPKTGFILSDTGAQRLIFFLVAQAMSQGADLANSETYRIGFDRLYQLGCFNEAAGEIGYDESTRVEEPVVESVAAPLTVADLETLNLSTKAGEKIARDLVSTAVFGPDGDAKILFGEWLDSLAKNFSYEMPEEVQREVINWFSKNNKSFLSHQAYDQCRINLCRRNIMPAQCLTAEDRLAMSVESADTRNYEGRRKLSQEIAAMMRLK